MNVRLDHVVVVVRALEPAVREFAAAGFTVLPGGRHDALPTENALICFADGGYLELLATREPGTRDELRALRGTPGWERHLRGVSAVARRFLPRLAGADGVADWALRSDSLPRDAARLRRQGVVASGPVAMNRERPDGERIGWEMLLPEQALQPFSISDLTPRERRVPAAADATTHANGARAIRVGALRAASVPVSALELADTCGVTPSLRAGGTSALELGAWRVEIVPGEPEGASAVVLAGCEALPAPLRARGVLPEGSRSGLE